MRIRLLALLMVAGLVGGCPKSDETADAGTTAVTGAGPDAGAADAGTVDAGMEDAGTPDAGETAQVDCTQGENVGQVITGKHSTDPLPAPQGGTPEDGTYVRTETTYYGQNDNGADTSTFKGTIIVRGNTVLNINQAFPDPETRVGGTWTVDGTDLVFTVTCGEAGAVGQTVRQPFTYSNGELRTYDTASMKESVYTRQPQ